MEQSWIFLLYHLFLIAYILYPWCDGVCLFIDYFIYGLSSWSDGVCLFLLLIIHFIFHLQFKLVKRWSFSFYIAYSLGSWNDGARLFFYIAYSLGSWSDGAYLISLLFVHLIFLLQFMLM